MRSAESELAGCGPLLLEVARESIRHGLASDAPLAVDPAAYPPALREHRASFVTLRRIGLLRGCTGHLEPERPLVEDVARSAHQAAFGDPRFPALLPAELADLEVHVSVLGPLEPLAVASQEELLGALRPGVDGLVLREGPLHSTFLPAVWETLPEPERFVAELKRKAGLPEDHWSSRLAFQRYRVDEFRGEPSSFQRN